MLLLSLIHIFDGADLTKVLAKDQQVTADGKGFIEITLDAEGKVTQSEKGDVYKRQVPTQCSPEGYKVASFLQDICHREDPTRPVTCGMDPVSYTHLGLYHVFHGCKGAGIVVHHHSLGFQPRTYTVSYTHLARLSQSCGRVCSAFG